MRVSPTCNDVKLNKGNDLTLHFSGVGDAVDISYPLKERCVTESTVHINVNPEITFNNPNQNFVQKMFVERI